MWRGRLPHWRADGVTYYVTFRHRRPLDDHECATVLDQLRKPDGKAWQLSIACVLPEVSEMMFQMIEAGDGRPGELADIVEKAKARAGKKIIKASGERFPPFYTESYDRIVRDDAEFEERFLSILSSPCDKELCEDPSEYPGLWVEPNSTRE